MYTNTNRHTIITHEVTVLLQVEVLWVVTPWKPQILHQYCAICKLAETYPKNVPWDTALQRVDLGMKTAQTKAYWVASASSMPCVNRPSCHSSGQLFCVCEKQMSNIMRSDVVLSCWTCWELRTTHKSCASDVLKWTKFWVNMSTLCGTVSLSTELTKPWSCYVLLNVILKTMSATKLLDQFACQWTACHISKISSFWIKTSNSTYFSLSQ